MEFYTTHTDYEILAVRIILNDMYKTYKNTFSDCMKEINETKRLSVEFYETVKLYKSAFDKMVCQDEDKNLSFFGLKTLINNKYLLLGANGRTCEKPCYKSLGFPLESTCT